MNAALINPFTNSGAHVPEAPESAAAIACPQPRAAAAPVSDGALYGSLPTGEIEPSAACASSEAATDPGREPVAADLCPRCKIHPIDPVLLGTQDEGHICGQCWIDDRTAGRATLTHNAVTQAVEIQSSCGGVESRHARAPRAKRQCTGSAWVQPSAGLAPGPHEANDDLEQLIGVAGRRRRRPLALPAFAPDFPALWKAMHDKTAPRTVLDPLWADASPLFLKG